MLGSRTIAGTAVAVGVAVALVGCSGSGTADADVATATKTVTATATPDPTPTATPTQTCGPSDGASAAAAAIAALPAPANLPDTRFDASTADTSGYEPCAALSWVTVTVPLATASSPVAILLFHDGRYLGTATKEAYGFVPDITRKSDDLIVVDYRYPLATDDNANPTGRSSAMFRWDAGSDRVLMTGNPPPTS